MAPNRKKKKPVTNPARGFSTTSTSSKTKGQSPNEPEHRDHDEVSGETLKLAFDTGNVSNKSLSAVKLEKPLEHLSPEELESELENSSLQIQIDRYREKTKRDASRQFSRLQTEKRLIRAQAVYLHTQHWLPTEIIQLIIDLYDAQSDSRKGYKHESDTKLNAQNVTKDDLVAKMWTLKCLLPQLGFSEEQTRLALVQLLKNRKGGTSQTFPFTKDSIWGLDECLDWLALTYGAEDLPPYSLQIAAPASRVLADGTPDVEATSDSTHSESTPSTLLCRMSPGRQSPLQESTPVSSESDFDSDLEPHQQISRYLALQSQIYDVNPALVDPTQRKPKRAGASICTIDGGEKAKMDRKVARLTAKLDKIKSDILFDREQAEIKWSQHWTQLVKERSERDRLGIGITGVKGYHGKIQQDSESLASPSTVSDSTRHELDTGDMFGDLFSDLPNSATDSVIGTSNMKPADAASLSLVTRSFGKWNGISPRRVFEEACRARDPSARIAYKLIYASNFSNRHTLEVRWSRPQHRTLIAPNDLVTCKSDKNAVKFEMASIACPDATQSEAYISTFALFVVFGSSPKEEKAYLRLPSIWREYWTELLLYKQEQDDAKDRAVLRELGGMIDEHNCPIEESNNQSISLGPSKHSALEPGVTKRLGSRAVVVPEEMKSSWSSKASTTSYQNSLTSRKSLPIWNYKDELLDAIEQHQTVIVCGETGCGKSTQVPAFILERELSRGRSCKVYCTEPRRISAIALARRVSEELGEAKADVGTSRSFVGYAIRLESQLTPQTRLIYATTGIVMRMLERSDDLGDITHLVLDEVHERSIDSDFLLIVLRKLLERRPDMKVVLMSATVDAQRFSNYLDQAPILNVPGRTFPVDTKYLEDAIELTNFNGIARYRDAGEVEDDEDILIDSFSKTTLSADNIKHYSANTRNALLQFDEYRINYDLILKLLETLATHDNYVRYSNAILVFLPGIAEIKKLNDMLVGHSCFATGWCVYALHSTIATEEQERAFVVPAPGYRKIVLATNIAETGITIPDVTCVIDTGKHKEMRFDERRQLSRLIEVFISRANAKQRRGRAGRVQRGLCFHLFTKNRHDNILAEEQTPEMLRLSLQDLVLRVKICKLGGIEQTLSAALDPPSTKNIRRAIDSLVDVKALTNREELTPLGRQLARLPLDVFLGKLVLIGTIFGCLDAALTIAAILSSKSPFSAPMGSRSQAYAARLAFKKGDSDLLTIYNAYLAWRRICTSNAMPEYQFCRKNFLNPQTLSNIEDLKAQLAASLADAGFLKLSNSEQGLLGKVGHYSRRRNFVGIPDRYNSNNYDLMQNTVTAYSFYPQLLKREGKGWRNIANNQSVSLHPTSVNKGMVKASKWLSFYHVMQSSSKAYHAHETSPVEDFAVALICGEAEFKMYAGVIVIDGNRIRYSVDDWKTLIVIKILRTQIRHIIDQSFHYPGRNLSQDQLSWLDIWQKIVSSGMSEKT